MKRLTLLLALAPGLAFASAPDGEQIFLRGNDNGALPCAACHGMKAQGNPAIGAPPLAGLPAPALETALARFAAGAGGNTNMQHIARSLSPQETEAVATYLAGLGH